MDRVYLIVGLGNPGLEYAKTRHNAGFLGIELLADRWKCDWSFERRFNSQIGRHEDSLTRAWLAKPQTFMNASGEAVGAVLDYYKIPHERLLVMMDDADLPLGQIRLKPHGSSGGHHGLESIERHIGSKSFARLKIGIGRRDDGRREITSHVLGKFTSEEGRLLDKVLDKAASQAACWVDEGLDKAMSRFNGVVSLEP